MGYLGKDVSSIHPSRYGSLLELLDGRYRSTTYGGPAIVDPAADNALQRASMICHIPRTGAVALIQSDVSDTTTKIPPTGDAAPAGPITQCLPSCGSSNTVGQNDRIQIEVAGTKR